MPPARAQSATILAAGQLAACDRHAPSAHPAPSHIERGHTQCVSAARAACDGDTRGRPMPRAPVALAEVNGLGARARKPPHRPPPATAAASWARLMVAARTTARDTLLACARADTQAV